MLVPALPARMSKTTNPNQVEPGSRGKQTTIYEVIAVLDELDAIGASNAATIYRVQSYLTVSRRETVLLLEKLYDDGLVQRVTLRPHNCPPTSNPCFSVRERWGSEPKYCLRRQLVR